MCSTGIANGDSVAVAAKRCSIAANIGYRWRQRFLAWVSTDIKTKKPCLRSVRAATRHEYKTRIRDASVEAFWGERAESTFLEQLALEGHGPVSKKGVKMTQFS